MINFYLNSDTSLDHQLTGAGVSIANVQTATIKNVIVKKNTIHGNGYGSGLSLVGVKYHAYRQQHEHDTVANTMYRSLDSVQKTWKSFVDHPRRCCHHNYNHPCCLIFTTYM